MRPQTEKYQRVLDEHFGVKTKPPAYHVITNEQKFFELYTGRYGHKFSEKEILDLDSEVSYFYDEATSTIIFKGFRRDGPNDFIPVKSPHYAVGEFIHEMIHNVQYTHGGYGEYDVFDEGGCELVRYVLVGDVNEGSSYFDYIRTLWALVGHKHKKIADKYKWVLSYTKSENKIPMSGAVLSDVLQAHPKVAINLEHFTSQCDGNEKTTAAFDDFICNADLMVEDLYALHKHYKSIGQAIF